MPMLLDIKYALRLLLKTPKFTALTLFVLVGGLTISLFTFSFLYSMLYKPLNLPQGESIRRISVAIDHHEGGIPGYEFSQVRDELQSFSEIGLFDSVDVRLSIGDAGKTIRGSYVEKDVFKFSRTKPIMGREFAIDDMQASANPVTVISHYTWTNEFQSDPNILGKKIRINDRATSVIGVMPDGYGFPINARLWLPIPDRLTKLAAESNIHLQGYARVKSGISDENASGEMSHAMNIVYQQTAKLYDKEEGEVSIILHTFPQAQTNGDGGLVFTFFNLIAFSILLLACINTGNLLLARAIERQKETAIRAAIGAPVNRLTLELMWEGIIITLLGSILSLLLVADLLDFTEVVFHSAFHDNLPFWWHWGMDLPTLSMALFFTLVTIFLASYIPARRSANQDINVTLRDGTRGAQSKKSGKTFKFLVTVQICIISLLMLIGSFSAFISQYLLNIETKENYSQIINGQLYLSEDKYKLPEQQTQFYGSLLNRLKSKQNVTDAVLMGYFGEQQYSIDDISRLDASQQNQVNVVSLIGNVDFYGPKLLQGRHLDSRDNANSRKTALISQSMAKRLWQNDSAIGQRVRLTINQQDEWVYIVGIIENLLDETPLIVTGSDAGDKLYLSGYQFPKSYQMINYHYSGELDQAEETFYQVLFSIDRNIEPLWLEPAEENMDVIRKSMKITSNITFGVGAFALLLALTGIYGLTANAINRRAHEIGIRRAVGASDKDVIYMFLKQGSRQLYIGLGLALFMYALVAYVFNNFSGGGLPSELFIIIALVVSTILSLVVMAAIYIPTKRAVAMEPSTSLRYQ